ncbi:MAG: hypothetical protein Q7K11_01775 [Candidatus Berkelbacteria bacterium]|nr:hypothetical protein [Candidatus Berkelbacteria bacterium]
MSNTLTIAEVEPVMSDLHTQIGGKNGDQVFGALKSILRGENPFPVNVISIPGKATWEARGELIYITLPASEGVTGPQWIEDLDALDYRLSDDAKTALNSEAFQPTPAGFVHRLVALKGTFWKKDSERTNQNIQAEGVTRKWLETHAEAVCIFRKCFSDKQLEKMGLWYLVGIHKPILVDGDPRFLNASRSYDGGWLGTSCASPGDEWGGDGAFFWSLPQETQS